MDDLKRVEYDRPPIVKAVLQVLLSWNHDEMLEVVKQLEEEAGQHFLKVERTWLNELRVEATKHGIRQERVDTPSGLRCTVADRFHVLIEMEGSPPADGASKRGVRCIQEGDYVGRAQMIDAVMWWVERIQKVNPNIRAVRASALVENLIVIPVPAGQRYDINDYIVPRFELEDPRLSLFEVFSHTLRINLNELMGVPALAIVIIQTAPHGILLRLDVVDANDGSLAEIRDRLNRVKDVETHVFESCITDKTRELYGRRN